MSRFYNIASCCFLFFGFQSCKSTVQKDTGLPNILLIVSEDHGQDLGCYGNNVVKTPNIDYLANNGIRFNNSYTTYSVCSPSRSSILTGLYPHQNGQIGLATHGYRMYDGIKTLPTYLKEAGYWSGCIGKVHVNPESEIPWDYRPGGLIDGSNFGKKNMPEYAGKAMEFIRQAEGKPFFLMVNYPDAHFPIQRQVEGMPQNPLSMQSVGHALPFVGANTERLREITADYYNCINRLDEAMGMLLDSIRINGMINNTFIIFLSDHGAQFSRGKTTNYEGALKIPLVMYWPQKIKSGMVEKNKLVSTIDLLPTILDAIGEKPLPEEFPGRSLLGIAQGRDENNWREYLFAGGIGCTAEYFFPRRSVRGERYKLIYNIHSGKEDPYYRVYTDHIYPQVVSGTSRDEILTLDKSLQEVYKRWQIPPMFELYDLQLDPWEFNDLSSNSSYKEELEKMKEVLFNWQKESNDPIYEPAYLRIIELEVDSIKKHYPNHSYQKDPNFQWKYPEYFGDFVKKKTFSKK
jgi:N-sulfoglucosamine sulfohydrolase